jgi:hypothetical protein
MNETSFNWRSTTPGDKPGDNGGGDNYAENSACLDDVSCTGEGLKNGERPYLFETIKGFAT